ncbi:MAG: hypothetical protein FVQ80_14540 [Planctomycetes bacterium]|nr:hypothetical protein [Planctomycetota bacterium]
MADLRSGCILFDTTFKFKDKEIGEKLIVILNNPLKGQPFLVCRTTSKEKSYRKKIPKGCQQKGKYFFSERGDAYFKDDTWLQLDDIYEYNNVEMLRKKFKGTLQILENLNDNILRQIKNCINNESEDISQEHLQMIVTTII